MFKPKSILALVLTLALALSSMTAVFAYTPPSDVMGTEYEDAAKVLGALDIMIGDNEGLFRPDEPIRRSEFAKIAVALLGLSDVAASSQGPTKFADVQDDHWATGYINVASNQKIIIGDTDGNFRPDDSISFQDAVTILVRVLGYEPSANAKGGYPTGFMVIGSQTGLIQSNTASSANAAAIRGLVANLSYNALTVNLMEQSSFGPNPEYSVTDKTLLVDKLKTEKVEGQVTANAVTILSGGASSLKDDEVQIGTEIYKVGETGAADFIGQNVVAYAKTNRANNTKDLILVQPDEMKTNTLTISGDNLAKISDIDSAKQLEYWLDKDKDMDTQKARIASDAILIYNNRVIPIDNEKIVPADGLEGTVELYDNNKANVYDVVKVTSFENYVVEDISELSNRINDKYGQPSLVLDKNDKSLKFRITKGSETLQLTDLKEWDVLSVAKSTDGKVLDIRVSNEQVQGRVTELSNEKRYIDGTPYFVAKNYTQAINLNDEGTFFLDINNKIAAVDASSTMSDNYAYLVAAGKSAGVIDTRAEFKFFTKEGTTEIIKGAEKMRLDNESGLSGDQVLTKLGGGSIKAQLVTFEKNSDGEITTIRRATDKSSESPMVFGERTFTKNFDDSVTYRAASSKLGSIVVNDQTIVFDIPAGVTDSTEYAIRDKSMFENEATYDIEVYDVGEDLNAKVVIVTNSTGSTSEESAIAVVDRITNVQDEEGNIVQRLYALQNGEMIEKDSNVDGLFVKDASDTLSLQDDEEEEEEAEKVPLEQGDIIQYRTNAKGQIDKITLLFDKSDIGTESSTQVSDNMLLVVGKVTKKFANSINVTVNDGATENYTLNDAHVYSYDSTKGVGQVSIASAGDIQKYDESAPRYVFLRIYKDEVKEVVILK